MGRRGQRIRIVLMTSLLNRIGINGYQVLSTEATLTLKIHIKPKAQTCSCPCCGGGRLHSKGRYQKQVRHLDRFGEPTALVSIPGGCAVWIASAPSYHRYRNFSPDVTAANPSGGTPIANTTTASTTSSKTKPATANWARTSWTISTPPVS
ncbi:MAG: transposase family protein [Chthoniobacteraceae bacterium]